MARVQPDGTGHHLLLADAYLQSGQSDQALPILIDLARGQRLGGEAVLQSIAALLAERPPEERMAARFGRAIEAMAAKPGTETDRRPAGC